VVSAWIGLGSNMANPAARISGAIDRLGQEPQLTLERVSSLYRTAPLEYLEQADFINAVARVSTILGAEQLLERLVRIETELGRTRNGDRYGPRVIDLDLLLFSDEMHCTPALTVPHPRLHQRLFVLAPLAEIEGDMRLPDGSNLAIRVTACTGQRVERMSAAATTAAIDGVTNGSSY